MKLRNFLIKILSSFFGVGYLPFIPGTFASIVAIFLFYLIKDNLTIYVLFILGLALVGFLVSGEAEMVFNKKDARCIVIDEIVGMLLALSFIPYDIKLVIIAFILFRLLDALKPYPAGTWQRWGGSFGIMSDDIVAGIYTNIIIQLVLRFAFFKAS